MRMKTMKKAERLIAVLLIAVLTVGMLPLLGDGRSYAEEEKPEIEEEEPEIAADDLEVTLADEEEDKEAKEAKEAPAQQDLDAIPAVTGTVEGKNKKGLKLQEVDFGDMSDIDPDTAVEIGLEELECEIIEAGMPATYMFTASEESFYTFYADSGDGVDPVGRVIKYDPEANTVTQVAYDDDSDPDDNDFMAGFRAKAGDIFYLQARCYGDSSTGTFKVGVRKEDFDASITVELNKSTGVATVTGTAVNETFDELYIDSDMAETSTEISGLADFEVQMDMKQTQVGLHTISASLSEHDMKIFYDYAVPTYVYRKPCNKLKFYSTGKNYISLFYGGDSYYYDSDCKIYMQYKKKGGKWSGLVGPAPISSTTGIKRTGLKAGKTYSTRLYYGKEDDYGGSTYLITDKDTSKPSATKKVKTGKAKPPKVKSVKITKAKTIKQRRYTIYYIGGTPVYSPYYAYYTTFKVTVRLKKKPGTAGIYIGTKRLKGNKKKYSTTFTQSGKLKGKVLKVAIYSYQSKTYGGFSPVKRRKARVR